jgi:hypothetical protein
VEARLLVPLLLEESNWLRPKYKWWCRLFHAREADMNENDVTDLIQKDISSLYHQI